MKNNIRNKMWTFKSFIYTLKIMISFIFVFCVLNLGFILIGAFFSDGIWNPLKYNLLGKILYSIWCIISFKSTLDVHKMEIKKNNKDNSNSQE